MGHTLQGVHFEAHLIFSTPDACDHLQGSSSLQTMASLHFHFQQQVGEVKRAQWLSTIQAVDGSTGTTYTVG